MNFAVSTTNSTWPNKSTTYKWDLESSSLCKFQASRTSGDGRANFRLMQWTTGSDYERGNWPDCISVNDTFSGTTLPSDDYYAEVTLVSGNGMIGTVTFSTR